MDLIQSVAPKEMVVSVEELLESSRIYDRSEETLIKRCLETATEWCEGYSNRQFVNATWQLKIDAFDDPDVYDCERHSIVLPRPPVQSITSIVYVDADGVSQTLASSVYRLLGAASPSKKGEIVLDYNQSWPGLRGDEEGVTVTYVAGYGEHSSKVPARMRQAVTLLAAHFYEHREQIVSEPGSTMIVLPFGVEELLSIDRIVPL